MPMLPVLLLASLLAAQPSPAPQCGDWKSCRDQAEAAAARHDYDAFHDLAWRTMQLRRTNDPDVMYMLARAQALSGRPHDALVMLGRIADMGGKTDAGTDPDFARVRVLPGWPELQARLDALRAAEPPRPIDAPTPPARQPSANAREPRQPAVAAGTAPPEGAGLSLAPARPRVKADVVAQFKTPGFSPGGIAYDAVSRRYLVGNLPERKLTEIEEGSNRPATLSGAAAQFFDVRALEIDTRQGDLWVVSDGAADDGGVRSALHKLQLISGRVLKVFDTAAADLPARFVDVAVARNGVLVLDAAQPRIFAIAAAESLRAVMPLPAGTPASIAPVDLGRTVYVAYPDRLLRVDTQRRTITPIADRQGAAIAGLQRIRWYRNSLVGVQAAADGLRRVVRLPIGRAGRVQDPDVLDQWRDPGEGAASAALIGDDLYYLVRGDGESEIRRIRLGRH